MKKIIYGLILVFAICFMLLLYEPLMMYITNIDDFWFDIITMLKPMLKGFILALILGFISVIIYYFLDKKLFKEKTYSLILLIGFLIFFVTYIEGNYLTFNLPALTGEKIAWGGVNT